MKKKSFNSKLSLKKSLVANLNNVRGGYIERPPIETDNCGGTQTWVTCQGNCETDINCPPSQADCWNSHFPCEETVK